MKQPTPDKQEMFAHDDSAQRPWRLRRVAWSLLRLFCVILTGTALLPLLPVNTWWIRIGDFPRIQLMIMYALTIVALLMFRHRRVAHVWMAALGICLMVQTIKVFPYTPLAPVEVESAESADSQSRLRLMAANVLQDNDDYSRLQRLVQQQQPDVLVLLEVNDRWLTAVQPLQREYPHHILHPLENKYGIALYSRFPLLSSQVRFILSEQIPSIDVTVQLPSGKHVRLFAVHPNPPRPGEDTDKRDGELVLVGREIAACDCTAVVMGDLNDVGWSRTTNLFQEVSGLLDPRKGRGVYPTFSAKSMFWRYPLDHLFHTEDFRVVELRTLPDIGSDHFPLLVELSHEPDAAATQEAPALDAGDREDAEEAVHEARRAVDGRPSRMIAGEPGG